MTLFTTVFFVLGIITAMFALYVQIQYLFKNISMSLWLRTSSKAIVLLAAICTVLYISMSFQGII